ncbi:hypothetical protein EDB85DRAFT_712935 [Lactarius pseudohatsudake]|nr:hypothetical protein EDB85DRAFT_712935 [Lactarius pseudohatsudake]
MISPSLNQCMTPFQMIRTPISLVPVTNFHPHKILMFPMPPMAKTTNRRMEVLLHHFNLVPRNRNQPPVNTGDPVTPPQKSEPDPGANGTPPGIPIFLGPSNPSSDRPPSGDIGPSSDPPWLHGDEKGFEDNSDPSCDGIFGDIFGGSLINVLSNNGGDGGDASSGKATSIANGKGGGGLSLSGPGGDASGGSVSAVPGLINILSNNGGKGGKAKSGDSSSYGGRGSSVSHSGPGGDASGGSVHSICSRRLPVSRTSVDHGSGGNVLGSSRSGSVGSKKKNDPPAAYTGMGGNASGGSVKGNHGVVDVWSGNGGNGGDASSGSAFAHGPGAKAYTGPGGNAAGGDVGRREPINSQISKKMPYPRLSPRGKYVPAHSSTGKFAASKNGGGGHHGGLINAWSGNGGDGGDASSGDAHAYSNRAPAYSGTGGHAAGGSVSGGRRDKVWKRDDGGARNKGAEAFTGHGGNASGGSVFGHSGLIDLIDIFSGVYHALSLRSLCCPPPLNPLVRQATAVMAVTLYRDPRMPLAVTQKLSQVPGETHPGAKESIDAVILVYLISHLATEAVATQAVEELLQCNDAQNVLYILP